MGHEMKIVHLVEATFAGVGRHVLDLAGEQSNAGHTVHVVYSPIRESDSFAAERQSLVDVTWHAVAITRSPSVKDFAAVRKINELLDSVHPDVIHGHSTKGGLLARVAKGGGAKIVYTPNALYTMNPGLGDGSRRAVALLEKALSKRTDLLIAVSPEERDHALELGLSPRSMSVIPNGIVPPEKFDKAEVRAQLGVNGEGLVLGFVGRLDSQKAPERLLDIVEAVQAEEPNARLVVVGDGPDRRSVEDLAASRNMNGVSFVGTQPGTWAMCAFDVFVLPSRYEGFPYVLVEAAHLGIPIVASTQSNSSYLATKYSAMEHVDGDDANGIAEWALELGNQDVGSADSTLDEFLLQSMAQSVERAYCR